MGIFDKQFKNNITFSDVAQEWLLYKQPRIKESTLSYYQYIIDRRLNDLANVKISKLKNYNFNNTTASIQEKLGKKSIKDTLLVLRSILKYADLRYDLDLNLDFITIPKIQSKSIEYFTKDEIERLEEYLKKSNKVIELGIWLGLYAGLKRGEVCALKWENINFKNRTIEIKNIIQTVRKKKKDGGYTTIDVLTENENKRIVPMNNELYEKLIHTKDRSKKENFVLTKSNTRMMFATSYRKVFNRVLKKCNIEQKKFQALRHTFAINCIDNGMDMETLKEILGHIQLITTLSTYIQPSQLAKQNYLNKLYK